MVSLVLIMAVMFIIEGFVSLIFNNSSVMLHCVWVRAREVIPDNLGKIRITDVHNVWGVLYTIGVNTLSHTLL